MIVSDDLDMKAVAEMFMKSGTIAKSIHAGCDLFIVSRNINSSCLTRTYKIAEDFVNCYEDGSLNHEILAVVQTRINQLLELTPQYSIQELDTLT